MSDNEGVQIFWTLVLLAIPVALGWWLAGGIGLMLGLVVACLIGSGA